MFSTAIIDIHITLVTLCFKAKMWTIEAGEKNSSEWINHLKHLWFYLCGFVYFSNTEELEVFICKKRLIKM